MNEEKTYYEEFILEAKKENKTLKEELFHADAPQGQRQNLISAGTLSQNRTQSYLTNHYFDDDANIDFLFRSNFMNNTGKNFKVMSRTVRSEQQFVLLLYFGCPLTTSIETPPNGRTREPSSQPDGTPS